MDTTDPLIFFNDAGHCNYCVTLGPVVDESRIQTSEKDAALQQVLDSIRGEKGSPDGNVIIGVSGGVDSSYLLAKAVEWGLKPIPVHVDAGWNSDEAVSNIHKLVEGLGLDLITKVIHWPSMRSLQLAFLRSGMANLDIPQDHVFVTSVLKTGKELGIRTVFSGSNLSTESVLPAQWGYDALDGKHIQEVWKRFGDTTSLNLPIESVFRIKAKMRLGRPRIYAPLDWLAYDRNSAVDYLSSTFGWKDYGIKHYESRWTRFFQSYVLPYRFGYDKRKAHLSSRVLSGEITRDEALQSLERPLYEVSQRRSDFEYVARKLGISEAELEELINGPLGHYSDLPNSEKSLELVEGTARLILRPLKALRGRNR
jgi:aminotransferase